MAQPSRTLWSIGEDINRDHSTLTYSIGQVKDRLSIHLRETQVRVVSFLGLLYFKGLVEEKSLLSKSVFGVLAKRKADEFRYREEQGLDIIFCDTIS